MEAFQTRHELASEDAAKHLHWEEERITGPDPAAVVRRQAACWNDAVNVRMVQQVLSPGMQNADHPSSAPRCLGSPATFNNVWALAGNNRS